MISLDITAKRAIEERFPVDFISRLAERESWRKELHQPLSYIHKWWARRLGCVFRAILIGACASADEDVTELLRRPLSYPNITVFDPFMGSGTTIYEAMKLGCRVIGRDINPVAYTMVHAALQDYSLPEVEDTFRHLTQTAGLQVRGLYTCRTPDGGSADVLYYFWVKVVVCPACGHSIDLFKSRILAKHAYPNKYPRSKSLCPECGAINNVLFDADHTTCDRCGTGYNPQRGVFTGNRIECPSCCSQFTVLDVMRQRDTPLEHRSYAKMVLYGNGEKAIVSVEPDDETNYRRAQDILPTVERYIPETAIQPGYNTNQILNHNYRYWRQMFNVRQLAALGIIAREIAGIKNTNLRELFACLFSGILEFNNMFASFKGIGTGAVRHLFSHHILKPEFTPLEANPWGTNKSSGSFSTLFESRIRRALAYRSSNMDQSAMVNGGPGKNGLGQKTSQVLRVGTTSNFQAFLDTDGHQAYVSVGDSAQTDIAEGAVDCIVTDPPFFDNVHYSELADFFHVWLRKLLDAEDAYAPDTTRSPAEVQSACSEEFASKLTGVFKECRRVLKQNGLLIFTYHHGRPDGWSALYRAVREAGFVVCKAYPVRSEMAVSVPVQQAKEPIRFDLILVCSKIEAGTVERSGGTVSMNDCLQATRQLVESLGKVSLDVSIGDAKLILTSCLLEKMRVLRDTSACLDTEIETFLRLQANLVNQVDKVMAYTTQTQLMLPELE